MELDPNHMMAAVKLPHPYEHVDGYFIFGSGDVWSAKRGKYLKPSLTPNGYLVVGLSVGGRKARTFFVHRLVAEAFIPLVDGKKRVNHKNGNKTDNSVFNLEWCTSGENNLHAYNTGLKLRGEKHSQSKLTDDQVSEIYASDLSHAALGRLYGVTTSAIHNIRSGLSRKWQWAKHQEAKVSEAQQKQKISCSQGIGL